MGQRHPGPPPGFEHLVTRRVLKSLEARPPPAPGCLAGGLSPTHGILNRHRLASKLRGGIA